MVYSDVEEEIISSKNIKNSSFLVKRPRRNRKSPMIRDLVQETHLKPTDLVSSFFLLDGYNQNQTINSMPGVHRLSIDLLLKEIEMHMKLGVRAIDLFPCIEQTKKDSSGSEALNPDCFLYSSVSQIKKEFPELCVIVDIALDPFTDHGHDGLVDASGRILNDPTIQALGYMSVLAAQAGADVVAPSDMMDGRVGYIRQMLDQDDFTDVNILAYTAKYASSFYAPFREALNSAPKFGDKKSYFLNPGNVREALLEAALDEQEGADFLMVKPALAYLDVIAKIKENTNLPVAAYHVSGEYAMVMAAAQKGWVDGDRVMFECLLSIKRAGASFILTYAAKQVCQFLKTC